MQYVVIFYTVDVNLNSLITGPKVVPTEFVSTTITTNNIATLKPDTTVTPNSTIITSTETPSTTTETTTTNPITTTTKPLTTTLTPNNNVTTTASPSPPAPSKGSYDSFSFFGK